MPCAALLQTRHRRAVGAVDVEGDQVIAPYARGPRAVDLRHHRLTLVPFELKRCIARIVSGRCVGLTGFVPALRDVGGAQAGDGLHLAEQIV